VVTQPRHGVHSGRTGRQIDGPAPLVQPGQRVHRREHLDDDLDEWFEHRREWFED
jgi:hypothetical protein